MCFVGRRLLWGPPALLGTEACRRRVFSAVCEPEGETGTFVQGPTSPGGALRSEARSRPNSGNNTYAIRQTGGTRIALILFVEYHAAFRQSASYLMDQEDDLKVVAQAGSVAEGRERMSEGGIDAPIVDIPLPDEGAEAMVRDLHQANPSIPVLVMTTIEDSEVHERFLEAGANEVLDKGISFAQILAAVRRLGGEG